MKDITDLEIKGVATLAALTDEPIVDRDDYLMMLTALSATFGAAYSQPDTLENARAKIVYNAARKKGYTKAEFRSHIEQFVMNQKFPNWLPGEFFQIARREIFTYQKALEKNSGNFERWVAVRSRHFEEALWIEDDGEPLPRGLKRVRPKRTRVDFARRVHESDENPQREEKGSGRHKRRAAPASV